MIRPLHVRFGNEPGHSLKFRWDGEDVAFDKAGGFTRYGFVKVWTRAAVYYGSKGRPQYALIVPYWGVSEIVEGSLYVRGNFRIHHYVDSPQGAGEAFRSFRGNLTRPAGE